MSYDSRHSWVAQRQRPQASPAEFKQIFSVPPSERQSSWRRMYSDMCLSALGHYTPTAAPHEVEAYARAIDIQPDTLVHLARSLSLEALWLDEVVADPDQRGAVDEAPFRDISPGAPSSLRPLAALLRAYIAAAALDSPFQNDFSGLYTGGNPKQTRWSFFEWGTDANIQWHAQHDTEDYSPDLGALIPEQCTVSVDPAPFITTKLSDGCCYEYTLARTSGQQGILVVSPSVPFMQRDDLCLRVRGTVRSEHRYVYRALHSAESDHRLAAARSALLSQHEQQMQEAQQIISQQKAEIHTLQRRNAGAVPLSTELPGPSSLAGVYSAPLITPPSFTQGANMFPSAAELMARVSANASSTMGSGPVLSTTGMASGFPQPPAFAVVSGVQMWVLLQQYQQPLLQHLQL